MNPLSPTPFYRPLSLAACLLLGLFTLSCEQDELADPHASEQALLLEESKANSEKINTYYGRTYPIGGGIMRSLVQINHNDEVVAIGMMISERSLHRLPHMLQQYVLDFHKKAGERTPFKHILFDWNPEGHEPDMFYGLPHFDLHLYTISNEERLMIVPDEPQTMEEIAAVWPYMPEGYVPTMDVVPQMGMHWIDPTAPEFQGEIFTHTMITGSYNDQFVFFEPMFTLDYLMGITSKVKYAIKPYAAVQEPGYYPTAYSFQYDPIRKVYIILLEDMEWR